MLTLTCEHCSKTLIEVEDGDYALLTSAIMAAHSSNSHGNHALTVTTDGPAQHRLEVKCVEERCTRMPKARDWTCEKALMAAYVVSFHAAHEGHELEISLDGKQFYP